MANRLAPRISVHDVIMEHEPWDGRGIRQKRGWRHVVLTSPAAADVEARFDPDVLRNQVVRVRKAVPKFWRASDWGRQTRDKTSERKRSRRDTSYVFALEVAPGGMVHVHALIYGEYIPQALLQQSWEKALGECARVYVTAVRGDTGVASALKEVLKYATKGEKGARVQAERAAAVELAFRNVHRVTVGGALRKVKVDEHDGAVDDVREADLHDEFTLACEVCGVIGEWRRCGVLRGEHVEANGGFGLLTHPPPR